MESTAGERKGMLFPSASVIRTATGSGSQNSELPEVTGLTWLSNQSFNPQTAQSRAHRHGDKDTWDFRQETSITAHHNQIDQSVHENLSVRHDPQSAVKEEFTAMHDDNGPSSSANITSDVVIKTERDEENEFFHHEQSDSDPISSEEDLHRDKKHATSRMKVEDVRQDRVGREKKHRNKEDSHRHKKSRKRHYRSDSSPDERDKRKHRKKKSKHKDDREKKKKDREDRERSSKEYKSHKGWPSSIWIDDIGFVPETPFYVDEKSDKNNLCFKSLHHTDLAFYQRLGKSCLGLDSETQMIDWGEGKEKKKRKKHSDYGKRYFDQVCTDDDVERIHAAERKKDHSEGMATIPEKRSVEMPYIPVKPFVDSSTKSRSITDENFSHDQEAGESSGSGLSEVVAAYNRHLQEHPGDIAKWLEFVRFQDQAFQSVNAEVLDDHKSTMNMKTSKKEQFILEKKLSILEKALKLNPLNPELQLEQMELCRETWDVGKLSKQWDSIIRQHSENLMMWKNYLRFKCSSFAKFTVSSIASVYSKYLNAMEAQGDSAKLDIVMQVCHFWRQSGNTEKAVALLQALVEFNCFCPEQVKESTTLEGKIAFFEPFLDSSEPHFGQPGAKGWAKWVEQKERGGWSCQPPDSKGNDEDDSVVNKTHLEWQAWLCEEVHRERTHFLSWQPAAGQTEDDCEDPERMVLSDDITPFLINFDSVDLKFELILRFLDFLGVRKREPLSCVHGTASETLEHPAEIFGFGGTSLRGCCGGGVVMSGEGMPDLSNLHNDAKEAQAFGGGYKQNKALLNFADNIIHQSVPLFPPEAKRHLTLLQIQYNLQKVDPSLSSKQQKKQQKEGQKYAKRLLSQECNRNNLSLWEEYAKWEWYNGNKVESQRIFETALAFSNLNLAAEEDDQEGTAKLLSTYAVLKLGIHQSHLPTNSTNSNVALTTIPCRQEVLHALTTLGEGGKFAPLSSIPDKHVSAGRILKARRGYVELYKRATDSSRDSIHSGTCHVRLFTCLDQQGSQLVHIALCYALFQYLSVGMQAAGVVFEETLSHLDGLLHHVNSTMDDTGKEVVHQQLEVDAEMTMLLYTKLVSYHVNSHPMPVTSLRNLMQRALRRYGNNPELLKCLIDLEAKSHIAGRLRRYFNKATSEAHHPMPWLYAINAELARLHRVQGGEYAGKETGITHRLRSLFDRASSNRHTRHCVLLWRLYILFEVQNGDPKRGKAIFYRALQHCPWAKILYMDTVRYYPEELQEVLDLLMEKEIRVRAPIEEVQLLMKVAQNKKE